MSAPGRRAIVETRSRLEILARPIAASLRARALAIVQPRVAAPRIVEGELHAGAAGSAHQLLVDAQRLTPILATAYGHDVLGVARAASSADERARNDAVVPFTHWVCDGLAELEALALLLGCARLGELDAAIADALDEWTTSGNARTAPVSQLEPAVGGVLAKLAAVCERGVRGETSPLSAIASIFELMHGRTGGPTPLAPSGDGELAAAVHELRSVHSHYRDELARIGAAIDLAAKVGGDRITLALAIGARARQIEVIAAEVQRWLAMLPWTAARGRWSSAHAAIGQVLRATLDGTARLVPLPP